MTSRSLMPPVCRRAISDRSASPSGWWPTRRLPLLRNAVAGANEKNFHLKNVNLGRDFQVESTADLRQITSDDPCPLCGGRLELTEGIEVGHIFKLGTSYSETMQAIFQDRDGQEKHFVMGCYGIGVSRVVAAAIEQNHDENGIIFPVPIAPFKVIILNLDPQGRKDHRRRRGPVRRSRRRRSRGPARRPGRAAGGEVQGCRSPGHSVQDDGRQEISAGRHDRASSPANRGG